MFDPHKIVTPSRSDPSIVASNLSVAQMADGADLPIPAKAFEVYNKTAADVVLKVTPVGSIYGSADEGDPFTVTVPAGQIRVLATGIRRVWTTGSTGLAAGITAGTVEVLLHLK